MDVLNINDVASGHEAIAQEMDISKLLRSGNREGAREALDCNNRLATLLKSLYLFADVYLSTLLAEILNDTEVTMTKFLQKPCDPLRDVDPDTILPAYTVAIYRNKLIAHHEVRRMGAFQWGPSGGGHRLTPILADYYTSQEIVTDANQLKAGYLETIAGLDTEENIFQQIHLLFYHVPIGKLGCISEDRRKADKLAERAGCPSLTRDQVVDAIDSFTIHVVAAAERALSGTDLDEQ